MATATDQEPDLRVACVRYCCEAEHTRGAVLRQKHRCPPSVAAVEEAPIITTVVHGPQVRFGGMGPSTLGTPAWRPRWTVEWLGSGRALGPS